MVRRTPKYALHKPTGQAYVRLGGRMVYLGAHGTDESLARYHAALAEYHATGAAPLPKRKRPPERPQDVTVAQLFDAFNVWAEGYYRHPDGRPTGTAANIAFNAKPLIAMYGTLPARLLVPAFLKQVREKMIRDDKSRSYINESVQRIRQVFKWGVEEGFVQPEVLHRLQAMAPLKAGRSGARETNPIRPVSVEDVETTLPHLPPMVKAMVQFQLLTAARPGEICAIRLSEIDRCGAVWMWTPTAHKTAHHGKRRVIAIGPKAQIVLQPWLTQVSGDADFVFAPSVGDFIRREHRSLLRKTPLNVGNRTKPLELHTRLFQSRYPVASYRRAISRACEEHKIPHWSPNQLRHAMATAIRREFGLEAAQVVLGHSRADVTQIYAEKNASLAAEVAQKIG